MLREATVARVTYKAIPMKLLRVLFDNAEMVFCMLTAMAVLVVLGWEVMR